MPVCKRTTKDPLLQVFLDTYGLNLLSIPRENAKVGDFYVRSNGRISSPGAIAHFLTPELELPEIAVDERMSDVVGKATNALSFSIGLSLLEAFFTAVGATGLLATVKAEYSTAKAHSLRFSFKDPRRDSLDPGAMGSKLIRHRFQKDHALVNPGNRYYLVTGVARSRSLSVSAATKTEQSVDLGPEVMEIAKAEGKVRVEKEGGGSYTYTGPKLLAFGVELHELAYDEKRDKMKMLMPETAVRVRSAGKDRSLLKPALVETEGDDAFFDLE